MKRLKISIWILVIAGCLACAGRQSADTQVDHSRLGTSDIEHLYAPEPEPRPEGVERDDSSSLVRLEWELAPPEMFLEVFETAVRAAVEAWEFKPAQRVVLVKLPDGAIEPEITSVPSAHRALIRFSVVEGRGVVE